MQAVLFRKTGSWDEVLEMSECSLPDPGMGELQVRVVGRPINPSDAMFIEGVYRQQPVLPQIAGLEGAAVVVKCGEGVPASFLGKQVGFRARGTWAEYINVPADSVRVIPDEIPVEIACQVNLNTITAYALLELAALKENDWLLLTAATSSVAQQVIQLAKRRDIHVIAVTRSDAHTEQLLSLGADRIINTEKEDLVSAVGKLSIPGINACLDAVGGDTGSALIKLAGPFAKIIIYGRLSGQQVHFTNGDIIYKNLAIVGFGIDAWLKSKSKAQLDTIWNEIFDAIIRRSLLIGYDKIYPLHDFRAAIKHYQQQGGRILLA